MSISQPAQITVPFGTGGLKNAIPAAADPVTGNAGYSGGFPAINMTPKVAGGIPPFGEDFNGIFFDVTTAIQFLEAGGSFPYSSAFSTAVGGYPLGAKVINSAKTGFWLNLVANNTTNPDSGGAGWVNPSPGPTIGSLRQGRMSIAAASASAVFTADEIVVETALSGITYKIGSFNKTINLATTGAGGMDTGSAPVSGFVGLYAILNPVTGASALLAVNGTSSVLPNVYGGANMPSGYTASALISVWGTNGSGQLVIGTQIDREIGIGTNSTFTTTAAQASLTSFSISAVVPRNAIACRGDSTIGSSSAGAGVTLVVCGSSFEVARMAQGATSATAGATNVSSFPNIPIMTAQTLYYRASISGGTLTVVVGIAAYSI